MPANCSAGDYLVIIIRERERDGNVQCGVGTLVGWLDWTMTSN